MSHHHTVLARAASCVAIGMLLAAGVSGCATSPEETTRTKHQIDVSVDSSGVPDAKPDIKVYEGDQVHWVFPGHAGSEFAVIFRSVADSPFDWSQQKGTQLWGTVKAGAAKDHKETEYKYIVDVAGKTRDPKIIVEP